MQALFLGVAVLACPIGMGLMMWLMMRGGRNKASGDTGGQHQVAQLRAEIDELKADRAAQTAKEQ
jgi:hypothetical protein